MAQRSPDMQSTVHLCAGVLPVWVRHLASSRTQSEAAVHNMLQAFSEMDPGLRQAQKCPSESRGTFASPTDSDLTSSLKHLLLPHLTKPEECTALISAVLQLVQGSRQSRDAAKALESVDEVISDSSETPVDRMYKGLQYQDRISQMMVLLEEDMIRLQKVIADPQAGAIGLSDWLARLETQYAMAEQRTNHSGEVPVSGGAASDETTFF